MPAISAFKNHSIHWVREHTTPALRSQLIAFWRENGAIQEAFEAWRRTLEVTCVAFDEAGQIAGISSVYAAIFPGSGAPYWFYRTFIRPDCRDIGLAPRLFACTHEQLALAYAEDPLAPVGMMVISENPKLETPAGIRISQRAGLTHLGYTDSGQSIWHRLFEPAMELPRHD